MKKVLYSIILLCATINISAQDISKKYLSRIHNDGYLYFIYPMEGFSTNDTKAKKDMVFDITYLTTRDSVTYNFTYYTKEASPTDSVFILLPDNERSYVESTMFYVEPKRKNWEQRASLSIPAEFLNKMYENDLPYKVLVHSKGNSYLYTMKEKDWKKQSAIVRKILESIKYSVEFQK
ncbi:hypothetical protein D0T53_08165 [Dysgonomonas sp. 216]|uniref:hypothetical protein n=1 Tax=Dysgonomonas sp. 216 TaxID=2302934 RepID=UPI0013D5D4C2|nr:hypothetical protein [Dysgonomonas sp. 216]NDW18886.1 hypothetical protein [Dysgonomonas sp. 216]